MLYSMQPAMSINRGDTGAIKLWSAYIITPFRRSLDAIQRCASALSPSWKRVLIRSDIIFRRDDSTQYDFSLTTATKACDRSGVGSHSSTFYQPGSWQRPHYCRRRMSL